MGEGEKYREKEPGKEGREGDVSKVNPLASPPQHQFQISLNLYSVEPWTSDMFSFTIHLMYKFT